MSDFSCILLLFHFIGVFIARGKEDALVTLNLIPGNTVYGEKKVSIDVRCMIYLCMHLNRVEWRFTRKVFY